MRLRTISGTLALAFVGILFSDVRVRASTLPDRLGEQIVCDLPGEHEAEIVVLDRLDRLRAGRHVPRLTRSCRLSAIAARWLTSKPDDDTYDTADALASVCDIDWQKLTLTLRVATTFDAAWDRILTEGNDLGHLLDDSSGTVGISIRTSDGQTWVFLVTVSTVQRPPGEPYIPDGPPTFEDMLEQAVDEEASSTVAGLRRPECDNPPAIEPPVWT